MKSNETTTPEKASTAKSTVASTTPAPSKLASLIAAAKSTVATLAAEVTQQQSRHSEIARLEAEKVAILAAVETGSKDFNLGKKELADASAGIELLGHTASRRAEPLGAEYVKGRAELVRLKVEAIGVIKRVTMKLVDDRQAEARLFLAGLGGSVSPNAWPVTVTDLIAADPVLSNLESLRKSIDSYEGSSPAETLIRAVQFADEFITAKGLSEPVIIHADDIEAHLEPAVVIAAWFPNRTHYDVLTTCKTSAEADDFMAHVKTSSTFAGARRVVRLGGPQVGVERFGSSRNVIIGEEAHDKNWLRTQGYADHGERFLADAAAFLKIA